MSAERGMIEIDTDGEIAAIIAKLNKLPDQIAAPNILKNALNATARKVRKQIVKDAAGQYALKDKSILKKEDQGAPKVYTASAADMTATIRSRGPMVDPVPYVASVTNTTATEGGAEIESDADLAERI